MTTTGQKRPWRSKFLKWKQVGLEAETEVDVVPRQFLHFPKVSMMSARFPVAENRVLQLLPAGKFELAVRNAGTAELFSRYAIS